MTRNGRGGLWVWIAGALLACGTTPEMGMAEESQEPGHRVHFRVESSREVANDWITASVGVTAENADPAALADTINTTMAWALDQARAEKRVDAKSGGYQTYPVHEKGKLRRWRASQDLILEGGDTDAMTALVGKLQAKLQLRSFQFSVSRATREKVQEELVSEVLQAFQARAELVRKNLGASGYQIDNVSIDTGHHGSPPRMRMEARTMSADVAPPAVEGGSSRVSVAANGSIMLE